MKKYFHLLVVSCLLMSVKGFAVPAYPHPIQVTQSDGSVLTIKIHGDEWFSYTTTEDNYLLKQNTKGDYEYAKFEDNIIVSTGKVARQNRSMEDKAFLRQLGKSPISKQKEIALRSLRQKALGHNGHHRAPNPLIGEKRGLVILVEFKDKKFVSQTAKQDFTRLLNEPNYNDKKGDYKATGSAKDYFKASTNNIFDPTFDVVGPYTLSGDVSYYGGNDPIYKRDMRPREMVIEACNLANNDVNFSDYDTDNNGEVDMVFIYYAGGNEAEGNDANTIWPHKWQLAYPYASHDGKTIKIYACSSELNRRNVMCGIGTFCHEFSHVLGLPDFYNTTKLGEYTVGEWDIMTEGPYNNGGNTPPSWLAHERFYLGYLSPTLLSGVGEKTLEPIITSNQAFLLSPSDDTHNLDGANPYPQYYYLLENKQYLGWDSVYTTRRGSYLGHGLLITKVNFDSNEWEQNSPNNDPNNLRFDVIEADGTPYSYTGDTYPGATDATQFAPQLQHGILSDAIITKIEELTNKNIKFRYRDNTSSSLEETTVEPKELTVFFDNNRNLFVLLTEEDKQQDLFVYNIEGKLIQHYKKESYTGNSVAISNLPKGGSYVISLGSRKKGKSAKVIL